MLSFMPSAVISCRRHSVTRLSVYPCVRGHVLRICEHDILQTTCGTFTNSGAGRDEGALIRF